MYGIAGDTQIVFGESHNVVGALFGESGPSVDALKIDDVAHTCTPFFESGWRE